MLHTCQTAGRGELRDFPHHRSHLLRQLELQEATLSQSGLQDLHEVRGLGGHKPRHQLQQLFHETVLEIRQLCNEEPAGSKYHRGRNTLVEGKLGHTIYLVQKKGRSSTETITSEKHPLLEETSHRHLGEAPP